MFNRRTHPSSSSRGNNTQQRFERYLKKKQGTEKVVFFDIGTKAIRILIGPKDIPIESWERHHFFNDATLTYLGAETGVNRELAQTSSALKQIISFINRYVDLLTPNEISTENFFAFGTAVFRWLSNKKEIVNHIKKETDLDIKILSQEDEATFTLCSVTETYQMRRKAPPLDIDNDILLLLDQGGGSMEVSYSSPCFTNIGLHSFDDLGTIALQQRFFNTDQHGNNIDPIHNQTQVSAQHKYILTYIEARITKWIGYPVIQKNNIHVYAMGSAVGSLFRGSNYEVHNRKITPQIMHERMHKYNKHIENNTQSVASLYREIQEDKILMRKNQIEETLLFIYGLPVYAAILKRFSVEHMHMCGYGLRYGVFIGLNRYNISLVGIE
jgi:exopolyphosphatase/pppGpp-phosphohydrolase